MSLNVFPPASPRLVLPETAGILGTVRAGPGVLVAQGTVIRSRGGSVSVGAGSAVLENAVVVGTPEHPVSVGRRTVFGSRPARASSMTPSSSGVRGACCAAPTPPTSTVCVVSATVASTYPPPSSTLTPGASRPEAKWEESTHTGTRGRRSRRPRSCSTPPRSPATS